jgi:ribosomal protein L25, Ctc-form
VRRVAPGAIGKVPAVLYGHGSDPQHLELDAHDFSAVLRHSGTNAVLTLDIDGKEQLALTKALEIHPIRRNIQHADLLVVRRGEKVTVEVNVVVEGERVRHPGHPGQPTPSRSRPRHCRFPTAHRLR